jgi:hypothetical protein
MNTKLVKSLAGSITALTIAAALTLSAQAGGRTKGAQLLLQPSQTTAPADTAPVSTMNCPMCKDVPVESVSLQKGHIRTVTYSQKHLCTECSTTIGAAGEGKAKKDVATHTCTMASGCAMTTGL